MPKDGLNPVAEDSDGDGVSDDVDAFPDDPAAATDSVATDIPISGTLRLLSS